tara:strand:- start:47 stop:514 length:468 start_codon:yes stop_codon:yes gene_type:complete
MKVKFSDLLKTEKNQWSILGGQLVTKILQDTVKGISQDGSGKSRDFPEYSFEYAKRKSQGKATAKGKSASRQTSPPDLKLTGKMLNSIKTQKATSTSVEINYRQAKKVEDNAKLKRNIYGLNDKNEKFAQDYFDNIIDKRVIKFAKKDITIKLGK